MSEKAQISYTLDKDFTTILNIFKKVKYGQRHRGNQETIHEQIENINREIQIIKKDQKKLWS